MGYREPYGNAPCRNSMRRGSAIGLELFHRKKVQFDRVPSTPAILTVVAAMRAIQEDTMRKAWITAGLALMLSCVRLAVPAQTTPQQQQDVLTPAPHLNLTLQPRQTIRTITTHINTDH